MTGRELYKIWAPVGSKWVDWARPVPFVAMGDFCNMYPVSNFTVPQILYMNKAQGNAAVIADLPGCDGIKEGIALARLGFRPVPLYNGTNGQKGAMALVDNRAIESALVWGASELGIIGVANDAPPAFLLDSNRMHRFKMSVSVFDNSWDLYDQDMPSAEFFIDNGIERIIVRGETIQKDLSRILYKHQQKGVAVLFTNGYEEPKATVIRKPRKKI